MLLRMACRPVPMRNRMLLGLAFNLRIFGFKMFYEIDEFHPFDVGPSAFLLNVFQETIEALAIVGKGIAKERISDFEVQLVEESEQL